MSNQRSILFLATALIVAICKRGRFRQAIDILELPLPSSQPAGGEWIVAYRHWRKDWYR